MAGLAEYMQTASEVFAPFLFYSCKCALQCFLCSFVFAAPLKIMVSLQSERAEMMQTLNDMQLKDTQTMFNSANVCFVSRRGVFLNGAIFAGLSQRCFEKCVTNFRSK